MLDRAISNLPALQRGAERVNALKAHWGRPLFLVTTVLLDPFFDCGEDQLCNGRSSDSALFRYCGIYR